MKSDARTRTRINVSIYMHAYGTADQVLKFSSVVRLHEWMAEEPIYNLEL